MFRRILKKDLKRKKTMNIIILLFVIMCSMFAAASVNNIIAVTGGIDHFFELSELQDVQITVSDAPEAVEEIKSLPSVSDVKEVHFVEVSKSKSFSVGGKKLDNFINPALFWADDSMAYNFFDTNNNIIKDVEPGWFWCTAPFLENNDMKYGDEVEVTVNDTVVTLKFAGRFKAAGISTESGASPHLLVDRTDYDTLDKASGDNDFFPITLLFLNTSDLQTLKDMAKENANIDVTPRDDMRAVYIYDMITAYIMMVVSIVLMLTAFVVLRFTIMFTISEEFREIGVMKAVGIRNSSIRSLYIVKYFAISVVGAAIGFLCSIPLSNVMLRTASENLVLGNEHSVIMGLLSAVAVVILIVMFCYFCTRKVRKLSPVDAVRNGQTGERFRKKSLMHLGRSKLPATGFMAANDVVSAPRQFSIITVILALGMLMIMLMSTFAVTLKSRDIMWLFDIVDCDATVLDVEYIADFMMDQNKAQDTIDDIEKALAEHGMPGKCGITVGMVKDMQHGASKATVMIETSYGSLEAPTRYDEGTAPAKADEIALTGYAMQDLNAKIGDTVSMTVDDKEYEFIITGKFSSFMNGGHVARVSREFDARSEKANSSMGIQIRYDGDLSDKEIEKNNEELKTILETDKVFGTEELIGWATGMTDTLTAIKLLIIVLTVIVTLMIVILMERSFISKEKGEIALMKAIGISNKSIIGQHTLRFAIVAFIAYLLSLAFLMPVGNAMMNWICRIIGDVQGVKCSIAPIDIFAVCPIAVIGAAVIGAFLTALYTKTIKASDAASIE